MQYWEEVRQQRRIDRGLDPELKEDGMFFSFFNFALSVVVRKLSNRDGYHFIWFE